MNTLGIDVSKMQLDVSLKTAERLYSGHFVNNSSGLKKLDQWLKNKSQIDFRVCLESTGRFSDLPATHFFEQGRSVHVVNPVRISAYRKSQLKRHKTDKEDAKLIAEFASRETLTLWSPPTEFQREIQEISRHLDFLKKERTRLKNKIKSGVRSEEVLKGLLDQLAFLELQIKEFQKKLISMAKSHVETQEVFQLLVSISGIGALTAAKLIAEVGDFAQYLTVKQIVAHAGLSPKIVESGSSVRRQTRLSKTGNKRLRTALYMPAIVAIKHNPICKAKAERMENEGKGRKVIICAVMRQLLHIAYGVVKNKTPFDPEFSTSRIGVDR